jgi:hypothetical protein
MKRIPRSHPEFEFAIAVEQDSHLWIVSPEDFDLVSHHWVLRSFNGYQYAYSSRKPYAQILMHRLIMERMLARPLQKGEEIDHSNHNTFDNRRSNLRLATRTQNNANHKKLNGQTSIYKGVSWDSERQKWAAFIKLKQKSRFLGRFDTEVEAAKTYNAAAKESFGRFALLNQFIS